MAVIEKRGEPGKSVQPRPLWWLPRPAHVMGLTCASLGLGWALVLLVDVANAFGSRDALVATGVLYPMLWMHLFEDRPIEWLQYVFLTGTSVTSGVLGGLLLARGTRGPAVFWILLSVGAALMLIEDAADIRHVLALYVDRAFSSLLDWEWRYWRTLTVLVYFAVLAAVPLYALLRYGRYVWSSTWTRFYLVLGFVVYGVAAIAQVTRSIQFGDQHTWYTIVGSHVINALETLGQGRMIAPPGADRLAMAPGFMGHVVEESVELISAAALLCAALAYLAEHARQQRTQRPTASGTIPIADGGIEPKNEQ